MIRYNPNELEKLKKTFPNLDYIKDKETIEGELNFCSRYKKITCNNIHKWEIEFCDKSDDGYVEDAYSIRAFLKQRDQNNKLPTVFETDGRIKKVAVSRRNTLNDLHLNSDESCCLGIFPPSYCLSLYDFVIKAVYPYFVWQAYFEKYKTIPPCGECPHDWQKALATRINEEENERNFFLAQQTEKPSGNNRNELCPCGSGKKYKKCCFQKDKEAETEINKTDESISYLKKEKEKEERKNQSKNESKKHTTNFSPINHL